MSLGEYYNYLSRKDIDSIGGLLAADEEFRPVKGLRSIFVSNYGRVISMRRDKPKLLKSHFYNGYNNITVENVRNRKKVRKCYYVHNLVAKTFLTVPAWVKDGDVIETHHRKKVYTKKYDPASDRVTNLALLPQSIHRIIDNIEKIEIYNGEKWQSMPFLDVAEFYGISPYVLHDFIKKRRVKNRFEKYKQDTYEGCIKQGDSLIELKVRVRRIK